VATYQERDLFLGPGLFQTSMDLLKGVGGLAFPFPALEHLPSLFVCVFCGVFFFFFFFFFFGVFFCRDNPPIFSWTPPNFPPRWPMSAAVFFPRLCQTVNTSTILEDSP